jgi:pilus assembly protein Flp/PilA
MRYVLSFLQRDDAATAVEYAVMLAMILLSVIIAIGSVGGQTSSMWSHIEEETTKAFGGG